MSNQLQLTPSGVTAESGHSELDIIDNSDDTAYRVRYTFSVAKAGATGTLVGSTAILDGNDSVALTTIYDPTGGAPTFSWVPRNHAIDGWNETSDSDNIMIVYTSASGFSGSQFSFAFRKAGLFKIEMSDFDIDPPAPTGAQSYSFNVQWNLVRVNFGGGIDFPIISITGGSVSASGGSVTKSGINPGSTQATAILSVPDVLNIYRVNIQFSSFTSSGLGGKGVIVPPLGSNSRFGRITITEITF